MKAAAGPPSRSVYLAQLRRAFLLRAHPDRFRNYEPSIRQGQARLLQALSDRMGAADFQEYTSNAAPTRMELQNRSTSNLYHGSNRETCLPYVLEKRNGSLLRQTLRLDKPVQHILQHMVEALRLSGAASLPPPPPPVVQGTRNGAKFNGSMTGVGSSFGEGIDHRFDINTELGRDLLSFLKSVSPTQVEERRSKRMDASTAALVARRLYSFQAIDGISMGWSSASFSMLLSALIQLHEEHSPRFHVQSFYPLRLVFSPDDFQHAFDLYGGILYLKPAATQLQWLEAFQEVTDDRLMEFHRNRQILDDRTSLLKSALGVKISKGYSCTSQEYHFFMEQISKSIELTRSSTPEDSTAAALQPELVQVTVESHSACRRPKTTSSGQIQVHSNMSASDLIQAVAALAEPARAQLLQERETLRRCSEVTNEAQWTLGLQNIYRKGVVQHDEFLYSLSRLLTRSPDLGQKLSGCSLGIAGSGHFCHLGDDGSLVIPHDWT